MPEMQETSTPKAALYLTFSRFWAVFTGYLIYFGLTRLLGPEKFGIYGVVVGIVTVINLVLVTGTMQAVSKFSSENNSLAEAVKRSTLKIQAVLGTSIFLIYFLLAEQISLLFNDPNLTLYIQISAFIILGNAFYSVFIGYINGTKQFKKQSIFDLTYNTLKPILILSLVLFGLSITGALTGFALTPILLFFIALIFIGFEKTNKTFSIKKILSFELSIMLFILIINLIMNIDLFLIKILSPLAAANLNAGYYTAALTIARLSYLAITPVTFLIFPIVSTSTFQKLKEKTTSQIKKTMRYSLILLALIAVLFSSSSKELITLLYSGSYSPASSALSILSFGLLFFSLFFLSTTIISASGKPKHSILIALVTLIISFILNYILIPKYSLIGAAIASTSALFIGLIICIIYLKKNFNAFLKLSSFFRILLAAIIIFTLSYFIKTAGIFLILELALLSLLYFGILYLIKELKPIDIIYFKKIFKRN